MSRRPRPTDTSIRSQRSQQAQSQIEKLNIEAETILTQKNEELANYQSAIDEAEKTLVKLKAELESKAALFSADAEGSDAGSDSEDDVKELEKVKSAQEAEIQELTAKQEEELATMRSRYTASLQEAESWAQAHAENIYLERVAELESLKKELEALRNQANEAALAQTQNRTKLYQQSKSVSIQNAQRIAALESELAELSSLTREELREVRAKIDECLSAVDIRALEHRAEIEKYEREIAQREEQYNTHLQLIAQQYQNEKQRLEQQLVAAGSKNENVRRVLAQLQKHHEMQIETTRRDNERMKATISQAKTRDEQSAVDRKSFVSQIQSTQYACKQVEQEIEIVNQEIAELQQENLELQAELQRLEGNAGTKKGTLRR
jgi:chromosome segregation ATPase